MYCWKSSRVDSVWLCMHTHTHTGGGISGPTEKNRAETILNTSEIARWPILYLSPSFLSRLFKEHIPEFFLWQTHPEGAVVKPRKRPLSESTNSHCQWAKTGMWGIGSQVTEMWTVRWCRRNQDQPNKTFFFMMVSSEYKARYDVKHAICIVEELQQNSHKLHRAPPPRPNSSLKLIFLGLLLYLEPHHFVGSSLANSSLFPPSFIEIHPVVLA